MTILYNEIIHEFDPSQELAECDRAQPLSVEPRDDFVWLTQWDKMGEQHFIMVERRDKQAFIEALMRA